MDLDFASIESTHQGEQSSGMLSPSLDDAHYLTHTQRVSLSSPSHPSTNLRPVLWLGIQIADDTASSPVPPQTINFDSSIAYSLPGNLSEHNNMVQTHALLSSSQHVPPACSGLLRAPVTCHSTYATIMRPSCGLHFVAFQAVIYTKSVLLGFGNGKIPASA